MNSAGYDSKFATLYYPWLEVMDPITKRPLLVPPSGHVAGVWCRSDGTRGVHKAPAMTCCSAHLVQRCYVLDSSSCFYRQGESL